MKMFEPTLYSHTHSCIQQILNQHLLWASKYCRHSTTLSVVGAHSTSGSTELGNQKKKKLSLLSSHRTSTKGEILRQVWYTKLPIYEIRVVMSTSYIYMYKSLYKVWIFDRGFIKEKLLAKCFVSKK